MNLATVLQQRMKAGALVVVVQEPDESLALASVQAACKKYGRVQVVSPADGGEAMSALGELAEGAGVLVIPDCLLLYGDNMQVVRMIREVALQERDPGARYSRLVLIEQPATAIPPALLGDVSLVTSELPTIAALHEELTDFCSAQEFDLGDQSYAIASAVSGLARLEARAFFNRCWFE